MCLLCLMIGEPKRCNLRCIELVSLLISKSLQTKRDSIPLNLLCISSWITSSNIASYLSNLARKVCAAGWLPFPVHCMLTACRVWSIINCILDPGVWGNLPDWIAVLGINIRGQVHRACNDKVPLQQSMSVGSEFYCTAYLPMRCLKPVYSLDSCLKGALKIVFLLGQQMHPLPEAGCILWTWSCRRIHIQKMAELPYGLFNLPYSWEETPA